MSRRPVILILLVWAMLSAACGLLAPVAPTTIPPTSAAADTPTVSAPTPTPTEAPTATSIPPTDTPTQPAPTDTSTPAALPTPSSPAEVYQAVAAAWKKLDQAGPYHVTQITYNGDTPFQQNELDVVPPNYHQVISLNGQVMGDQYLVDGTLYNQIMGAAWVKIPGAGSSGMSPLAGYAEGISDQAPKTDGKVAGMEDIDGKPAIDYSYSLAVAILNVTNTHTVSVDQASGLVVKQVIASKVTKTVQTFKYDPSITFSLPDEAKNAKGK